MATRLCLTNTVSPLRYLLVIALSLLLSACALMSAKEPAKWSGFIQGVDPEARMDGQPWDHAWEISPDYSKYNSIMFKSVRTDFVDQETKQMFLRTSVMNEEMFETSLNNLTEYMTDKIYETFAEHQDHRLEIVEAPRADTLVVETALTEVVFHNPAAYVTALLLPVPGSSYALDSVSSPSIAFEMKVTDGESGELISTIADRALPAIKPVDFNKFTASGPLEEIIDTWCAEIAQSAAYEVTRDLPSRPWFKFW